MCVHWTVDLETKLVSLSLKFRKLKLNTRKQAYKRRLWKATIFFLATNENLPLDLSAS